MLNCSLHRFELDQRIDGIHTLITATHSGTSANLDAARQARGLSILLMYAAYEHLLTSLGQSLLEAAIKLRVGNKRLQPGLRLVAAYPQLQSLADSKASAVWKKGIEVVDHLTTSASCTITADVFPNDGTNFKKSQILTFCKIFGLTDPAPVLKEVWVRLDTIVTERNSIAHGKLTPEEVGRGYSLDEMNKLVDIWQSRWTEFIAWVESAGSHRNFYRTPR